MVSIIKYNAKKRTYTGTNENDVLDASNLNYEPIGKTNIKKNLGLIITGGNGDDKITGTDYNDTIKGGNGNDRITGGLGVDNITGGAGITTINYSKGDGNDVINLTKGENFTLNFTDLTIDDLRFEFTNKNKDLRIYTSQTSDDEFITIKNFVKKDVTNNSNTKKGIVDTSSVELVVGGKTYDLRTSKNLTDNEDVILYKTTLGENAKNFTGTWLNDEIDASGVKLYKKVKDGKKKVSVEKEFKDTGLTLKGGVGNDSVTGTKYSDKIYGNKGNDTINAGTGNNYIYFNKGDGNDIIENGNGIDTLVFAKKTQLSYSYDKYDLIIKYSDNDTVTLKDYLKGHSVQYVQIGKTKTVFNPPQPTVEESQEDGYTIFNGSEIADTITGTIGKDKIYGNDGNDTIDGRQGENIYYFKTGDKNDIIKNGLGTDTIVFSENQNLSFIHNMSDNDLILLYGDNDSIVLKDYYVNNSHSVKNINNNGTIISIDTAIVQNNICKVYEKNYNSDTILVNNSSLENFIYTKNNNDLIITFSNDDKNTILLKEFLSSNHAVKKVSIDGALSDFKDIVKLYFEGTNADESIKGTDYDDTITAKKGNDIISGGNGKNTYIFNQNDGNDTILKGNGTDTIKFNQEVDIRFSRDFSNSDLVLNYGDNDSIRLQNYYTNNSYSVKSIINGTITYTLEEALNTYGIDVTGNSSANNIIGTDYDDTINAGKGNDKIDGGNGNNTYVFNTGDGQDTIINGDGTDTIKFEEDKNISYNRQIGSNDLIIEYGNNDSIKLKDYFVNNFHSTKRILNGDEELNITEELLNGYNLIGTSGTETFDGTGDTPFTYVVKGGNDTIENSKKTDVININTQLTINYSKADNQSDLIITYGTNKITIKNYFKTNNVVQKILNGTKELYIKDEIEKLLTVHDFKNTKFTKLSFSRIDNNLTITYGTMTKTYNLSTQFGEIDAIYALDENNVLTKYSIKRDAVVYLPNETTGTYYNDKIIIDKPISTFVDGKSGNDIIINENIISEDIDGGAGNDTIINNGTVTRSIDGGDGNNTITNNGTVKEYIYGSGRDSDITNNGTVGKYICCGYGKSTVTNNGTALAISAYSGEQNIINNGTVTACIYGGFGNATIINNGKTADIQGENGNDTIINKGIVTNEIYGGVKGDNTITNEANGVVDRIKAGYGNDIVTNNGTVNDISGGEGDDTITNNGTVSEDITGSDGNDTITNNGTVTRDIIGGEGTDIIITGEKATTGYIKFHNGDGHDTLYLNAAINNISMPQNVTYSWLEDKVVIRYNNNQDSVTIKNYNPYNENVDIYVNGTNLKRIDPNYLFDETFYSCGSTWSYYGSGNKERITINGGIPGDCTYQVSALGGDDIIINNGSVVRIEGNTGNDKIENYEYANNILGDEGDDEIINYGIVTYQISGGEGNDIITNNGTVRSVIWGGAGNDTIITGENSSTGYIHLGDGGNDILYLNASINNLSFSSAVGNKTYSWKGDDLVIKYNDNKHSVTIKNYNPSNTNIVVKIGTDDENYVNLKTLVPTKPKSMSLGTSNTRICELSAEVLAFTSSGSSDMQLNYSTPDINDITAVMSEYTKTDLQNI